MSERGRALEHRAIPDADGARSSVRALSEGRLVRLRETVANVCADHLASPVVFGSAAPGTTPSQGTKDTQRAMVGVEFTRRMVAVMIPWPEA